MLAQCLVERNSTRFRDQRSPEDRPSGPPGDTDALKLGVTSAVAEAERRRTGALIRAWRKGNALRAPGGATAFSSYCGPNAGGPLEMNLANPVIPG
jgi:hypothetical protein